MKNWIQWLLVLLSPAAAMAETMTPDQQETVLKGSTILLEDFSNPIHKWSTMNDPVMGGKSRSALAIENGVAKFTGLCDIVPFLKAPGFITMVTGGFFSFHREVFPDVSSCSGLSFVLKTNVDYKGYRISFGKEHVKGGDHAYGYKAGPLINLPMEKFGEIVIPFDQFSSKWDDATGDITVTCAEDEQYCPSARWLSDMETISFWGEGVEGEVDLEIQKIAAVGCSPTAAISVSAILSSSLFVPARRGVPSAGGGLLLLFLMAVVLGVLGATRQTNRRKYDEVPQIVEGLLPADSPLELP